MTAPVKPERDVIVVAHGIGKPPAAPSSWRDDVLATIRALLGRVKSLEAEVVTLRRERDLDARRETGGSGAARPRGEEGRCRCMTVSIRQSKYQNGRPRCFASKFLTFKWSIKSIAGGVGRIVAKMSATIDGKIQIPALMLILDRKSRAAVASRKMAAGATFSTPAWREITAAAVAGLPARRRASRDRDGRVVAEAAAKLAAELAELRAQFELLGRPDGADRRMDTLLEQLRRSARMTPFTAAEVLAHAQRDLRLKVAIIAALGKLDARRLGRALGDLSHTHPDKIRMLCRENAGAVWQLID